MTKKGFSRPSGKDKRIFDNLKKALLQYISAKRYAPMDEAQLFQVLCIHKDKEMIARKALSELLAENLIEINNNLFSVKEAQKILATGVIRVHQRGFGFVIPDDPEKYPQDIFIPKQFTESAVDGDRVEVEVFEGMRSEKGPEGRVTNILERGREHAAGIIRVVLPDGSADAFVPLLGASKNVTVMQSPEFSLKIGDRFILKILDWGSKDSPIKALPERYLGHISDPSIDIIAAIAEFNIRNVFPKEVVQEALEAGAAVKESDFSTRENFENQPCVTIDPTTAKDFDDAIYVSRNAKGEYFLAVHIADVAHYVRSGTKLDNEAKLRCNSTYFPGKCVPMLPEELSNGLCSLKADVFRLTVSVLMDFDSEGTLINHRIVRSVIKSGKRFTYEEAKEVLDGQKESAHKPMLESMVELCQLLKQKRKERGSIDFSLPELIIDINKEGVPTGTHLVEYDITHQMVEEFMLKANEVVAQSLEKRNKPLLFRIHEEPTEESFQDFYQLVRSFGFHLSNKPSQTEIQQLFEDVKKTPFAQQLSVAFIRSMRLAYYSSENVGHFGLALEHYTHFTSPIRRYTDLIIQRLLFNEEFSLEQLEAVALASSDQERISFKAESSVKILKKLRLLSSWQEEDPSRVYEACVTKVKPFGFFFEVSVLSLEGFLHVSDLDNDYFIYQERQNSLVGKRSGKTYTPSTPIQVQLANIDLIQQETFWTLSGSTTKAKKRK